MQLNGRRSVVAFAGVVLITAGTAACSDKSPEAQQSASALQSSQAAEIRPSGVPGGIVGTNLTMAKPSGNKSTSYVYGTLKNFGAQTNIVRATALVATAGAVLQQGGATAPGGIPAPVGTTDKTVIPLTPSGYRVQLNGVN